MARQQFLAWCCLTYPFAAWDFHGNDADIDVGSTADVEVDVHIDAQIQVDVHVKVAFGIAVGVDECITLCSVLNLGLMRASTLIFTWTLVAFLR